MSAAMSSASPITPATSAAREPLATGCDTAVTCMSCEVDFDDFADASEAQHFAGLHNDLHGHGRVTGAEPVDLAVDLPVDLAVNVDADGW